LDGMQLNTQDNQLDFSRSLLSETAHASTITPHSLPKAIHHQEAPAPRRDLSIPIQRPPRPSHSLRFASIRGSRQAQL
jgi:hypothetical protein